MREVAKVTRFNPGERQGHMTRFVRKLQGATRIIYNSEPVDFALNFRSTVHIAAIMGFINLDI